MSVTFKVTLVADMHGNRTCLDCRGNGWIYGYRDNKFVPVECKKCKGNGRFREETLFIPTHSGQTLHSYELSRDPFGRYVHVACNGGGVRFFGQRSSPYWSCTSCRSEGLLTPSEWVTAQDGRYTGFSILANASGAEKLLALGASLKSNRPQCLPQIK